MSGSSHLLLSTLSIGAVCLLPYQLVVVQVGMCIDGRRGLYCDEGSRRAFLMVLVTVLYISAGKKLLVGLSQGQLVGRTGTGFYMLHGCQPAKRP